MSKVVKWYCDECKSEIPEPSEKPGGIGLVSGNYGFNLDIRQWNSFDGQPDYSTRPMLCFKCQKEIALKAISDMILG